MRPKILREQPPDLARRPSQPDAGKLARWPVRALSREQSIDLARQQIEYA